MGKRVESVRKQSLRERLANIFSRYQTEIRELIVAKVAGQTLDSKKLSELHLLMYLSKHGETFLTFSRYELAPSGAQNKFCSGLIHHDRHKTYVCKSKREPWLTLIC